MNSSGPIIDPWDCITHAYILYSVQNIFILLK